MKKVWKSYIGLAAMAFCLAGCSYDMEAEMDSMNQCAVRFSWSTEKAEANHAVKKDQLMRLFVGERKPEHGIEELHLLKVLEDVKEGKLTLEQLKPQWYKFVFMCVPRNGKNQPLELFTEENPGEATCDLNKILIDYEPILKLGAGSETPKIDISDGNIYRKVVSRWLEKGKTASENVVLTRLNGQLVVDMGILCDQFQHPVDSVFLVLTNHPTRLYITDNDKDQIKTTEFKTVYFGTKPDDQHRFPEKDRTHHKLIANLLPCILDGKLIVRTVSDKGEKKIFEYPLKTKSEQTFQIKPNTKTTLKFNGINKGDFDVKYAGWDSTKVNVSTDEWVGWEDSKPTPDPAPETQPKPEPEPTPKPQP